MPSVPGPVTVTSLVCLSILCPWCYHQYPQTNQTNATTTPGQNAGDANETPSEQQSTVVAPKTYLEQNTSVAPEASPHDPETNVTKTFGENALDATETKTPPDQNTSVAPETLSHDPDQILKTASGQNASDATETKTPPERDTSVVPVTPPHDPENIVMKVLGYSMVADVAIGLLISGLAFLGCTRRRQPQNTLIGDGVTKADDSAPQETVLTPVEGLGSSMACKLQITVICARNLRHADAAGKSDPYCVVTVGEAMCETLVVSNTLNPLWNTMFEVDYKPGTAVNLEVWDKEAFGIFNSDDALGKATLEDHAFYPYGFVGELQLEGGMDESTLQVMVVCVTDHDVYRVDGGGWRLVRRVSPNDQLHPAKDHLKGEHEYGIFDLDPEKDATFSRKFHNDDYDEMLLATGSGDHWMIAARDEVAAAANNEPRTISAYSGKCGAYRSVWQNMREAESGPWIGPVDAFDAGSANCDEFFLYGTPVSDEIANRLEIRIVKARHLLDRDGWGKSDPFVEVTHGDAKFQTNVVYDSLDPVWNAHFELAYVEGLPIEFKVWDKDQGGNFNPDDVLGQASLEGKQFFEDGFSGDLIVSKDGSSKLTVQIQRYADTSSRAKWSVSENGLNVFIRRKQGWATKGIRAELAKTGDIAGVFHRDQNLPIQMWLGVGESDFVFPELRKDEDGVPALQAKPNFAVCVSGGGYRATACALGWIRAFQNLGVLAKARYLCSNSGGSWFNTVFSYQQEVSTDDLLGKYIPPEELMPDAELGVRSYAQVIADARMLPNLIVNIAKGVAVRDADRGKLRAWSDAVGDAFFSKHGLNDADCGYAIPGQATEHALRAGMRRVHQACREPTMPYPIICGTIMPPGDERIYLSYEFTPQYSGIPAQVDDNFGGVLVEPRGANSVPPPDSIERDSDDPYKKVTAPLLCRSVPPLIQVAGISSGFIAQNYANSQNETMWEIMGCEELNYWDGLKFEGRKMGFADGGGTDNMAIFPALRRGVQKLVICCAIGGEPGPTFARDNYDISGYFGAVPEDVEISVGSGKIAIDVWNRHLQVFPPERCDELVQKMLEQHEAGEPLRVRVQMQVLENVAQGVKGGYDVDTLWLFNSGLRKWCESGLPDETRQRIEEDIKGFPYMSTMKLDYTPAEVTCLNQLACWNAHQAHQDIKALLLRS